MQLFIADGVRRRSRRDVLGGTKWTDSELEPSASAALKADPLGSRRSEPVRSRQLRVPARATQAPRQQHRVRLLDVFHGFPRLSRGGSEQPQGRPNIGAGCLHGG